MVSLLDVAPVKRKVPLSTGQEIEVGGVSASGIAFLLDKFPEFRQLISGMKVQITVELVAERIPGAVTSIIAAGCGMAGNADAEKKAAELVLEDQMALLTEIMDISMPGGVRPFVEKVQSLMGRTKEGASAAGGKAPATK